MNECLAWIKSNRPHQGTVEDPQNLKFSLRILSRRSLDIDLALIRYLCLIYVMFNMFRYYVYTQLFIKTRRTKLIFKLTKHGFSGPSWRTPQVTRNVT